MVHTAHMRPPVATVLGLALAPFLIGTALLGPVGPAQAALDSYLVVGYDTAERAISVTAGPGLAAMGDDELVISGDGAEVVLTMAEGAALLVFDPAASATLSCGPGTGPQSSLSCVSYAATDAHGKVLVDMSAASVATTTAVDPDATGIWLTFRGGSGPDYVQGGRLGDRIAGGSGDDDLFGGRGDDEVLGQEGNDQVDGERGSDRVDGGPGDDYVVGDGDVDVDEGQKGDPDWISGGPGVDEVDARDGVKDHRVDCENAPGLGKVTIDYEPFLITPATYLDVPYNCPLILAPTAPRELEAFGARDTISATWNRPEFDGNATALKYQLGVKNFFGGPTMYTAYFDDTDTNVVIGPYPAGIYYVTAYAISETAPSPASRTFLVSVGNAAGPPTDVLNSYYGKFDGQVSWGAAPKPGDPANQVTYQVSLRVKDKANARWQKWTTLPESTTETTMDLSGSLKLFQGRVYQARVRTKLVGPSGLTSEWVYAQERFVGDLPAPTITSVKGVGGKNPKTTVSWKFEGMAWKYNAFDVLSPAILRNGVTGMTGTVTYAAKTGIYTGSFALIGSKSQPTCTLRVEYAASGGPLRSAPGASVMCAPK